MGGFFLCPIARNSKHLANCFVSLHTLFYSRLIAFYFVHYIQRRKGAGPCSVDSKKGNFLSSTYSKETKNLSNDKRISRERIRHEVAFF